MGEMANEAWDRSLQEVELLDLYLDGGLSCHDAYELGLVDESGALCDEGSKLANEREIQTLDWCNKELESAEKDLLLSCRYLSAGNRDIGGAKDPLKDALKEALKEALKKAFPALNLKAILNIGKEHPTCNVCGGQMEMREGIYGKFYHCKPTCSEQGTVGFSYWKKVRAEYLSVIKKFR